MRPDAQAIIDVPPANQYDGTMARATTTSRTIVLIGLLSSMASGCAHLSSPAPGIASILTLVDELPLGTSDYALLSRFGDLRSTGPQRAGGQQTYILRSSSSFFTEQTFSFQDQRLANLSFRTGDAGGVIRFAESAVESMEAQWGSPTTARMSLPDAELPEVVLAWEQPERHIIVAFTTPEGLLRRAGGLGDSIGMFIVTVSSPSGPLASRFAWRTQPFQRSVLKADPREFEKRLDVAPAPGTRRLFPSALTELYLGASESEFPNNARRPGFMRGSSRQVELNGPLFSYGSLYSRRGRLVLAQFAPTGPELNRHALFELGSWCERQWGGPPSKLFRLKSAADEPAGSKVFVWEHRDAYTSIELPAEVLLTPSVRIAHRSLQPQSWFSPEATLELLSSNREAVRIEWERSVGDPLPPLLKKLGDSDAMRRAEAVRELGVSGDPRAHSVLEEAFVRESSTTVLLQIPYALNRLGGSRNETVLAKNLAQMRSKNYRERLDAIWAFRQLENPEAIPALREVLANAGDYQLQQIALSTLAHLKDEQLPAEVTRLLNSRFQDANHLGLWGLKELLFRQELDWGGGLARPDPGPYLPRLRELVAAKSHPVWPISRQDALSILVSLNDSELPVILAGLISGSAEWDRKIAAEGFGKIKSTASVASILAMADSAEPGTRSAAVVALGALGDVESLPTVLRLAKDSDDTVRAAAAAALGKLGGPASAAALELLSRDPNHYPRYMSLDGWAASKSPMPQSLALTLLNDSDEAVRDRAATYLFECSDSASLAIVFMVLGDPVLLHKTRENSRRMFLHRLLHQENRNFLNSYLDLVGSSEGTIRRVALSWLRSKGPRNTPELLRERLPMLSPAAKDDAEIAIRKLESGDTKPDDGLIGTFAH